jgi:hypothetical protein
MHRLTETGRWSLRALETVEFGLYSLVTKQEPSRWTRRFHLKPPPTNLIFRKTLCDSLLHAAGCAYRVDQQSVRIDCEDITKALQPIALDGKDC